MDSFVIPKLIDINKFTGYEIDNPNIIRTARSTLSASIKSDEFLLSEIVRMRIYHSCIVQGEDKLLKKILDSGYNYPVHEYEMLHIFRNKFKKTVELILKRCKKIYVSDKLVVLCAKNGWNKFIILLYKRKECYEIKQKRKVLKDNSFRDITDVETIMAILSLGNYDLTQRILISKKLDYEGEHAIIMKHLCKTNDAKLVSAILNNRYFDPDYDGQVYIIIALRHNSVDVINLFEKRGLVTMTDKTKLYAHLMTRGGI